MKKKTLRFNIYLPQEDYDAMVRVSSDRGDMSYAETIRVALATLVACEKRKVTKETLFFNLEILDSLKQVLSDGKHLIVEDPKNQERIRILIPGLK